MKASRKKIRKSGVVAGIATMLALFGTLIPLGGGYSEADAYKNDTSPASIGSLTHAGYETFDPNEKVFDTDVLAKLYDAIVSAGTGTTAQNSTYQQAYNAVSAATSSVTGFTSDPAKDVITFNNTMDYATLSVGGTPITVDFGGYKWNIVYLTSNTTQTTGGTPDLVATLWLSEETKVNNATDTVKWNGYSNASASVNYPSSMYSTSKIRVETLNGGGDAGAKYATSTSDRDGTVSQADRINHQFSQFTLSDAVFSGTSTSSKSLTEFLVTPNKMPYQQRENWIWSAYHTSNSVRIYQTPNEAWGIGANGPDATISFRNGIGWCPGGGGNADLMPFGNTSTSYVADGTYTEWANDYLWLPSMTEMGFYDSGTSYGVSLWGIPLNAEILRCNEHNWSRSGYFRDASAVCMHFQTASRSGIDYYDVEHYSLAYRPALHLNLTAAEKNSSKTTQAPSAVTTEYNGKGQSLTLLPQAQKPGWYEASLYEDTSKVTITYTDSAGATVTPRDAGTYKAKIELLTSDLRWNNSPNTANGEDYKTRVVNFTISKKKIGVTITDDDGNGIPDKVTGDSTALCTNDSGTQDTMPNFGLKYGSAIGVGTATPPQAEGSYYATAEITDTNSNYEIDTSGTSHYMTYQVKGGVAAPYFASGAAGTVTATAKYTGSAIEFPLFVGAPNDITISTVSPSGIAYNSTDKKFVVTGGVGTYTAKASLNDPTTKEWSGGNSADIAFTITITKGDYDFSSVKWQYQNASGVWTDYPSSGIEYTGSPITVQVSGLPAGLSALPTAYTDNSKKDVNTYTAQVTALTGANTTNYNAVNVAAVPELSLAWEITKKQIVLNWSTSSSTTGSGDTIMIPNLPTDSAYTVAYYADSDWDTANGEPNAGATKLTASQLQVSATSSTTYYARAELNAYPYAGNYEFDGQDYQQFSVGGGKTAVLATLNNGAKVYDNISYAPQMTVTLADGTPASVNLSYKYYEADGTTELTSGAPTNAGVYYVEVSVSPTSSEFAVSGTSKFRFEIEKATYDLAGLKWSVGGDTFDINDAMSFVYDGNVKTLQLAGLSDVTSVGSVPFGVTLGGDYAKKDAGTHTVTLTVTEDTDNYNPSGLPTSITWTITPMAVDLSNIAWNYDASNPFVFTCDENGVVEHSVAPILPDGLPQEIIDVIESSYSGVYREHNKGTYVATAGVNAALQNNNDIQNNYIITYLTDFASTLNWRIGERTIDAPEYDNSWTLFDGLLAGHDMAALCGFPEDWANYLDLVVTLTRPDGTKETYQGYDGKLHFGNDAGTYELAFAVRSGLNESGKDANVWLGDGEEATVTIEVAARTVTVESWRGTGTRAQAKFVEDNVLSDWYAYVVYDSNGNVATPNANGKYAPGTYSRTVEPTSQNIEIKFAGAEAVAFTVDENGNEAGADIAPVDRPTFNGSITYTGKGITITDENAAQCFDGWDADKMTIRSCDTGKDAGEYNIVIALKDTVTSSWSDDGSVSPMETVWTIGKAKLSANWTNEKDPVIDAGEFEGLVEFDYRYFNGETELTHDDLQAGQSYTVRAKLREEYEKNFEFTDAEGNVLEDPTESEPYEFVKGSDSWLGKLCEMMGLPFDFPLIQVILTALFTLLFILFLILWIVHAKKKKESKAIIEQYEDLNV